MADRPPPLDKQAPNPPAYPLRRDATKINIKGCANIGASLRTTNRKQPAEQNNRKDQKPLQLRLPHCRSAVAIATPKRIFIYAYVRVCTYTYIAIVWQPQANN